MHNSTAASFCLQHSNPRFLQVRDDFLAICDGNEAEAKILHILEGWTNFKRSKREAPCVWMSCQQFIKESRNTLSQNTIYRALNKLIKRGYIKRIINPKDPYGAPGYLLSLTTLQRALDDQAHAELLAKQGEVSSIESLMLEERVGDVPLVNHCLSEEREPGIEGVHKFAEGVHKFAEGANKSDEGGSQICGHTKTPKTYTKNTAHTLAQEGFAQEDEEDEVVLRERGTAKTLAEVASILRLPVTPELQRLVEEYAGVPDLSLAGEADRACEWIADPTRNRKHQPMTPGFFRTWIKNEVAALRRKEVEREQLREVVKEQGVGGQGKAASTVDSASHQAVAMAMYPDMSDLSRKYEQMKLDLKLKKQSKKEPEQYAS